MAQSHTREVYADGSIVYSNLFNDIGVPLLGNRKSIEARVITHYWDGTPMTDDKVDNKLYSKIGNDYVEYLFPFWGENFLEKDTMAQMRAMEPWEIILLRRGYWKGVKLNGYYIKGDTPAPIEYYLSDTTITDNEGTVVEMQGIKLEYKSKKNIDLKYFGYDGSASNTDKIKPAVESVKKVIISGKNYLSGDVLILADDVEILSNNAFLENTTQGSICLRITGNNARVVGLNIDCKNFCQKGIRIIGKNSLVESCVVENILGFSSTATGIEISDDDSVEGVNVRYNIVRNISAPSTGNNGDSVGSSRGIYISGVNKNKFNKNYIYRNTVHNITGREGDGIQVFSKIGSLPEIYDTSYSVIDDNDVSNCNRRYIKAQSSNVIISNNRFENSFDKPQMANANAAIGVVNSNDVITENNSGDCTLFPYGISVSSESSTVVNTGNIVRNNNIQSGANTAGTWDNLNAQRGIYINRQDRAQVLNNTTYFNGRIELVNTNNSSVIGNTIDSTSGLSLTAGVLVNLNCNNNTIKENRGISSDSSRTTYFVHVYSNLNNIEGNRASYTDRQVNYSVVRLEANASENTISKNYSSSLTFTAISSVSTFNNYILADNSGGLAGSLAKNITVGGANQPTLGNYKSGDVVLRTPNEALYKSVGSLCVASSSSGNGGTWVPFGIVGVYQGTSADPNGVLEAKRGNFYFVVGANATATNFLWFKTTDTGNTGWEQLVLSTSLATTTKAGTVKQGIYVEASTATDVAGVNTVLNNLIYSLRTSGAVKPTA